MAHVLATLLGLVCAAAAPGADLQSRINQLPKAGGTILLKAGAFTVSGPLNLRGRAGVRIVGQGVGTVLSIELPRKYAGAPLIDMSGATHCELSHFKLTARGPHRPGVGILLAREKQDGASAGMHRFDSLIVSVGATVADVANYGSEVNTWTHCQFYNALPGGGNYVTGRTNVEGISSPFGPVAGGSNLCHHFTGCGWGVYAHTGTEVNIKIHNRTGYFYISGGSMSNKTDDRSRPDRGGRAGFQIGGPKPGVPCEQIVLDGLQAETWGAAHSIEITGLTIGLTVRNCLLQSLESSVHVGGQLEDSLFRQNTLDAGFATYSWSPAGRGLISVAAPCEGNVFDLRWRRLGRLARDATATYDRGWPRYSICVQKGGRLSHNEVRLRNTKDLFVAPGAHGQDNELRVRP